MAARRAVSQRIHKRTEEANGWIKMVAGLEQTKFRGCDRVGLQLRRHRLQSDPAAEAVGAVGMSSLDDRPVSLDVRASN